MKTNPSEVFILNRIDTLNSGNKSRGATLEAILTNIDQQHGLYVVNTINNLKKIGVLETIGQASSIGYRLTGNCEGASEEVKHYVRHRTIPD